MLKTDPASLWEEIKAANDAFAAMKEDEAASSWFTPATGYGKNTL